MEKKFEPQRVNCKKGTVNCRRRRFVIVFLAEHYSGDQMKDDEMRMCNEWRRRERYTRFWFGSLIEENRFEDAGIQCRIMFKWILRM
jgi:hypothetical protein